MGERKLASIRRVLEIRNIPNADFIELAIVDGWQCVVKKGEVQVNENVVYFEIDSVLPVTEKFEFLRKDCYVKNDCVEGFRLRTIKLRKQISQGLVMPMSSFPELTDHKLGDDVTDRLGIVKFEKPDVVEAHGIRVNDSIKPFPEFIPRTDQERIQNCFHEYIELYQDHLFEVTLKLDGTSCTLYQNDGVLGVCSRNYEISDLEQSTSHYVRIFERFKTKLIETGRNIAIQGEIMGPRIQGNREELEKIEFYAFDVFDIDRQQYMNAIDRQSFLRFHFPEMSHVPVLSSFFPLFRKYHDVETLLDFADQPSMNHQVAEGLVCKCITYPSKSFKIINNQYLLQEK